MLNFIYYPVSAILWFWHKVFGAIPFLGPASGVAWALAVVFLVFTLRTLLIKPFVSQVRSMRKMQEFAPEIQKLKKKYGNDRQKMGVEMQKLQAEHGVNPLASCLPIFVQIPVFIGLFHVLKSFNRDFLTPEQNRQIGNYFFGPADVRSFLDADLLGAPLSAYIIQSSELLARYGDVSRLDVAVVAVPLTILAGVLTHLTSRHSVARQTEAQAANPQAAIMNKVMLYLFPIGVVAGGPFFPLAILLYWLSNNAWTLGQQYVIYHKIDAEEAEKDEAAVAQREALGPRPGQKPVRAPKREAAPVAADEGSTGGEGSTDDKSSGDGERSADGERSGKGAGMPNGAGTPKGSGSPAAGGAGSGNGKGGGGIRGGTAPPRTRTKKSKKRR